MLTIGRGQHGSTYGGNPLAAAVAKAALEVGWEGGGGRAGLRPQQAEPQGGGAGLKPAGLIARDTPAA
jgi:hypothetical protein